jgi:SNF2 family DNA or RNA helicase
MRPARLGTKAPAATAPALRPFQQEDVDFIKEHDYNVLVASSPGTGKTPLALSCVTGDRVKLTPTVVVCPASVVTNWCREAKKWVPGAVIHAVADLGSPMPRKRVDIVVISWALLADRYLDLVALKPKFIIADEVHYVKESEALRSQAFSIVARRTPHMILLSGTPVVNKSGELATIKSYFNVAGEVPMIRRLLEDVLPEIPPKSRSTLSVRLRPKDAADYQRAEEDFADWLDRELKRRMSLGEAKAAAERALAAEALTKTGYLRRLLGLAKVPSAVDWISRAVRVGEPVVVFCEHQEVVTRLQKLLTKQNIRHVTIDGGTGRKQRQHAIDTFQAGFAPVFIGTKAAKEGITLTRARNLLFVERYFTSADEEQAEDRIRRFGQKYETTIWFLHAAGTLDDRLSEIIDTKRRLVNEIIGGSTVEETEEDAVRELIAAWHDNAVKHHQPDAEPTDLGLGKPLPPLPDPRECYQLTFKKPRWAKPSATVWCAMHGFRITEMAATTAGVRVTSVPLARFVPGTFSTVQVSADITAVLGTRKPTVKKAVSKPRTGSGKTPMGAKKVGKKRPARSTPSVSIRSPLLGRW